MGVAFSSGLQVSAPCVRLLKNIQGHIYYLQTKGPAELAVESSKLSQHGKAQHPNGFGSPVGRLVGGARCLSLYSKTDLENVGITLEKRCSLEFESGVRVNGFLKEIERHASRIVVLSFINCRVEDGDGGLLFDPAWGAYDMAVAEAIAEFPKQS